MVGITLQDPRGTLLKSFLKSIRLQEAQRLKQSYQDRGAGTLQDGYTPEEMIRVSMYYYSQATEVAMRDRATFLMQHTMLLRGESTRRMELPDIFTKEFELELKLPKHPEEAAVGACIFASVANGNYRNIREAQKTLLGGHNEF